jgi:hypothetical protein
MIVKGMKIKVLLLFLLGFAGQPNRVIAQETRATNVPTKARVRSPVDSGPGVYGRFDGRFPCAEIAKDWKVTVGPDCTKVKWSLTLFQNPKTGQPTTYKLRGTLDRSAAREGKWALVHGTKTDPDAVVFQLDSDKPAVSVYLLKGDENVLFVLDQERNFRVGDSYLSYTLNRVVN